MLCLPDECLLEIFDNLDVPNLIAISQTCKRVQNLVLNYSIKKHLIEFTGGRRKWPINLLPFVKRLVISDIASQHWDELVDLMASKVDVGILEEVKIEEICKCNQNQIGKLSHLLVNVKTMRLKGDVSGLFARGMSTSHSRLLENLLSKAEKIRSVSLVDFIIACQLPENVLKTVKQLTFYYSRLNTNALIRIIELAGGNLESLDHSFCSYDDSNRFQLSSKLLQTILTHAPNLKKLDPFSVESHHNGVPPLQIR